MAILAGALTGKGVVTIGIHADCQDGLDNDGDQDVDFGDNECYQYPYSDGAGESPTPMSERYQSNNYVSLFDWHLENAPPGLEPDVVCVALAFGYYNDVDAQKASQWVDENGVDCTPYQP